MGFLNEFKEFAAKGNAIDMAVGIVIGAAFGKKECPKCCSVIPVKARRCPQCMSELAVA